MNIIKNINIERIIFENIGYIIYSPAKCEILLFKKNFNR